MTFKLFTEAEANAMALQIVEIYAQTHNVPIVGAGVILPIAPERQKNRTRQSVYKNGKSRFTCWITEDTDGIISPVIAKIVALQHAKKAWRAALGTLHRHERELLAVQNRVINTVPSTTNTQAKINAKIAAKAQAIIAKQTYITADNLLIPPLYDAYQNLIE